MSPKNNNTGLLVSHRHERLWSQAVGRLMHKKIGLASLVVIVVLYLIGILSPWVTPYGYNEQDLSLGKGSTVTRACAACKGPSLEHPFGTDRLGRDLLTRIIFGLRTTVIVSVASITTGSMFLGIGLGLVTGYFGKKVDTVVNRIGEVFLAFPGLLLVILIAATVRPRVVEWVRSIEDVTNIEGIVRVGIVDYFVIFGALAAFSWVGMQRLVRGQVLYIKESQYVEAAYATGASVWRILMVHILPNLIGPVIVVVSMGMGAAVGSEIVLSWLGVGIQPPTPSLGVMIFENGSIGVLRSNAHLILFPVGVVTLIMFAFNLLGDALNDAINPRIR